MLLSLLYIFYNMQSAHMAYVISVTHHLLYIQGRRYLLAPLSVCAVTISREQQSTFIIRWWSVHNHHFIGTKRSVCCSEIMAKRRANSLRQTGWRFMYTLACSHGVTRRGMTRCTSTSLLVLDRWSCPDVTVPSLFLSTAHVNFMYLFYWQLWLIGNVKNVSVPSAIRVQPPLPSRGLQRLSAARSRAKDLWLQNVTRVLEIYVCRIRVSFVSLKEVASAVIAFDRPIPYIMSKDHHVKWYWFPSMP